MNIIGGNEFEAEFLRPWDQMTIHPGLFGNTMVLQFEEEIFGPERLFEPIDGRARLVQLLLEDQIGNFTGKAAGHRDQTLAMPGKKLLIDARLVIITFEVRGSGKFD